MKKKLFIILFIFLLWGIGGFAQSSSVTVTPITADYNASPPTVTFKISWPGGSRDANHRSKVWLLVDYRRIINNAYTGGWLRAGISSAHTPTATTGSTVSLVPGNTKGFWLQGTNDAFAATVTVPVTVDLTGYDYKFGWCGVASDRPPTAVEYPGYYALHGTPDFIIQTHPTDASQTVTEHTTAYNDCIYALTDSTGAPGETPLPAITGFHASAIAICAGQSATLTATTTNAERYSFDGGVTWGSSSTTVVSPLTTTAYILKATREKGACTVTSPTTITITVNDLPVPQSLTADPDVICAGQPATLTASASGAASYSLNGSTWTASTQLTDYPTTTTTYTLYIKSAEGCTASLPNASTVTVNTLPAAPTGANTYTGCIAGYTAFYVNEPEGGITIDWYADATGGNALASGTATIIRDLAAGAYAFYAEARNTATQCVSAVRAAALVTINPEPDAPTSASSNTRCGEGTVTFSATVPGDVTIDWYNAATSGSTVATGVTSYSPTLSAPTTYYAQARNKTTGCVSAARLSVTGTVHNPPEITLASGSTNQTVDAGTAISQIEYNTPNATGAVLSGQPTGVTGSWSDGVYTISGTPTAGGNYNYTVTTVNINGCTNASATGTVYVIGPITYTGCTTPSVTLSTVGFSSSDTWTRNGLTISAPVTATYCEGRCNSYNGGSSGAYQADCSPNAQAGFTGHLFSWCMVVQYAYKLCPSPWRVPTREDHCQILNGSRSACGYIPGNLNGVAGYVNTGEAIHRVCNSSSYAIYWSSAQESETDGSSLCSMLGTIEPTRRNTKHFGLGLRCVQ